MRAFHGRLREAASLHDRALALNPNLSMAWALSALVQVALGELDEAQRRLDRYKQLSPMDPGAFHYDIGFCLVALLRRDYEGAVAVGRSVSELNPSFAESAKPYLAALGHLGQMQEAAVVRRRLSQTRPDFTVSMFLRNTLLGRAEDRECYAEGLRKAGLPEG